MNGENKLIEKCRETMGEGEFVSDFLVANLDKIIDLGVKTYGKVDAKIQINLRTAYTDYLNETRLKYSKSKTFLLRDTPVELYSYYVPTSLMCNHKVIQKPDIKKILDFTKRITITGTGGSGKSILLKHLFLDCIQQKLFTPILIELRDLNSHDGTLSSYIFEVISNFGFKSNDDYINGANSAGHFCYFFDGYDEIDPKLRKKIIREISALAKKYPECPIILSSRPDDVIEGLDDFSSYKMMPLDKDEALELIDKIPFDPSAKAKFRQELSSHLFAKHESFLSNPLLLSIMLLTFRENAEIPSKLSLFYSQAFEALFSRHDAYKDTFNRTRLTNLDSLDFTRVFSLFCIQTYDKRLFKMSKLDCLSFIEKALKVMEFDIKPEDYFNDLKSATCLMIEEGFDVSFTHRSFQEYFVALYISTASPEIQTKLINQCWVNINSDQIILLLREMNPDLFERSVLIPKLEDFFKEIKVVKSVGVTHHLRYLKQFFNELKFDKETNSITLFANGNRIADIKAAQISLVLIAATEYAKWSEPSNSIDTYNIDAPVYKISSLNINSPIIKEINHLNGWHSLSFLEAAYTAYKKVKLKHARSSHNFSTLLGI